MEISVIQINTNGYAEMKFKEIHEEIPAEEQEEQEFQSKTKDKIEWWMWLASGLVALVIVFGVTRRLLRKK